MTDAIPATDGARPPFTMLGDAGATVCEGDACLVPTPQQRVNARLDSDEV
ncbi:hypothetical protein QT381_02390 [Galbitalea sp. SE-J8]|nr:hypothetical protein [Galbitalea sp. SE-J8]MDM4761854.1 hypothetical protein [Galbitalea sp. SE-J8]